MRVLIVTAASGQGHVTAARNLEAAFEEAGAQATVLDAGTNPFIAAAAASYNFFLRRPPRAMAAYFAAVHALDLPRLGAGATRGWAERLAGSVEADLAVSVHPILNFGIARAAATRTPPIPFRIVVTDLCPPFWKGWVETAADLTLAPTAPARDQLVAWGAPREQVEVAGMPIPASLRVPLPAERRSALLGELGLEAGRFTLLLNAGSSGRSTPLSVLEEIARARSIPEKVQAVFVAGRNERLKTRALEARRRAAFPVAVLGWRDDVGDLLALADAVFTKAGGLSVAEALARGVPVLVDACEGVLPQERGGADWVEREALGWRIRRPGDVAGVLEETTEDEWRSRRARCAAALPGDAGTIARRLLA